MTEEVRFVRNASHKTKFCDLTSLVELFFGVGHINITNGRDARELHPHVGELDSNT